MAELINNNSIKPGTKDYLDVVSKPDAEMLGQLMTLEKNTTLELIKGYFGVSRLNEDNPKGVLYIQKAREVLDTTLTNLLNEKIPAFTDSFMLLLISVTGSQNYGTSTADSDADIRVVYTERLEKVFSLNRPNTLNFHERVKVEYEDGVADLDIQFIHISTYLRQLSKSNYNALEMLTSRFRLSTYFAQSDVNIILRCYNFNYTSNNIASMLVNKIEDKHTQRLYKHLLTLNTLNREALITILSNGSFWGIKGINDISEEQVKPYLERLDKVNYEPDPSYIDYLNSLYYTLYR